tara:strand:- start:2613 stop:3494 length:882 start_codon:yes stop_codon:yes gene_type:complete
VKTILLGQNHLHTLGGSETFTYTMAKRLTELGHQVDIVTMQPGYVSELISRQFGCNINNLRNSYDVAFLNHTTIINGVRSMFPGGKIIQTCHGIYPDLEQPVAGVEHVSISQEVSTHLNSKGFGSTVIHNGIDCEVFSPLSPISPVPKKVFSLSQSDEFNQMLSEICKKKNLEFSFNSKFTSPRIDIHNVIRESDLVFSLGRGAYESMACARSVIIADKRQYQAGLMDGIVNSDNISGYLENNCSGRKSQREVSKQALIDEIEKYDPTQGIRNRQFALTNLNIANQVEEYLKL